MFDIPMSDATKLQAENERLKVILNHLVTGGLAILPEVRDFVSLREPCGYYCDESAGHVDHPMTNWLNLTIWELEQIQAGTLPLCDSCDRIIYPGDSIFHENGRCVTTGNENATR